MKKPSLRAQVVTRRTYNRPLNDEGTLFETWEQTVDRVISHQKWLWERAKGNKLTENQKKELSDLRELMVSRKIFTSGRTLWLGGTDVAKSREASQFNCSGLKVETVWDVVDLFWLLLQGCGVGFVPVTGTLNGFFKPVKQIETVRSTRTARGNDGNQEIWDADTKTWTIKIGDSAEAWSKSIGKILAGKYPAEKLVLDYSEIRPGGTRLKGYGWISSGDNQIHIAYEKVAQLMNRRAGSLLTKMDILDLCNLLGTVLSSRRSAEVALFDYGDPEWRDFALAKKDFWLHGNEHRQQSNNSLLFWNKPTKSELSEIFKMMEEAGGSEPGFVNAQAATRRAPWFSTANPCLELLLPNKGFCNLVEVDVSKFLGDTHGLHEALRLASRANYRQTCVDFRDGILQESWHLNNRFLRLCGVGITGLAMRPDLTEYDYKQMNRVATFSAYGMADELGMERPKNVCTLKPSGTLSKVADCTEGIHKPLGRYIFNNINFGIHDPLVPKLKDAGYKVFNHPTDATAVLVTFPVKYDGVEFDLVDGVEVNLESAVSQLERYKMIQNSWCDYNVSNTISYSQDEVEGIVDWLLTNWDSYVGVSFIYRTDPTKTAKDLGYLYLPQEVVTKEVWDKYASTLREFDVESVTGFDELQADECAGGACPIR